MSGLVVPPMWGTSVCLRSTQHPGTDFRGHAECIETCWWRPYLQIRQQQSKCYERHCLKILFKLLRADMQTAYFFTNDSILLTELFIHFPMSRSRRTRRTKRRLFCIEFPTPSWLCLVLAMCWEKLCECTILMLMKHWGKMPPDIFLYSSLESQWLCISIMWNIFLWWTKGAKEVWAIDLEERMTIWFELGVAGREGGLTIAYLHLNEMKLCNLL